MKKIVLALAIIVLIIVVFFTLTQKAAAPINTEPISVTDFRSCLKAGDAILESYPRQCRHNDELFVEEIGNALEKNNLIRLTSPLPGAQITSPLTITGEARGTWFFEATFPISLTNWDGLIIAEGYGQADGEWMTEDFVPFNAKLYYEQPGPYPRGALILQKNNPSGLPQYDDALEIPVWFF